MTQWLANDALAFLIALVLAGIIIPQILLIAFRKKLFDEIDARKIHQGIVPRLGGIAFFPSILFSLLLVIGVNMKFFDGEVLPFILPPLMPVFFMICAVLLMFLVGIADDLVGVRYVAKFIVQIIASVLIVFSGVYVSDLFGLFYLHNLYDWFGWLVTSFVVVYIVNAINLIDGIDGLASGLSTVAFIFYGVIFFQSGEYIYSMIACASAGTLLPFFYFNVFGNATKRKKIFMGDTGALTTGMILVFLAIAVLHIGEFNEQGEMVLRSGSREYNPVIIALSPLIIPCFDVVRVYLHRVTRHRNPFLPDKCHIHHKLLALGFSQRAALCIIMVWSMIFILANIALSPIMNPTWLLLADIAVWTVINMLMTRSINCREKESGEKIYD